MEGNQMKMREALENIAGYAETARCHTEDAHVLGYLEQIEKWANEALSAPSRQCDVGTPEEQRRRFNMFCKRKGEGFSASAYCAYECPCGNQGDCKLAWAQTPYEAQEGGAE